MAKPLRTRTRSGRLASVFSTGTSRHLHSVIASLSVLFEDLRLELNGMAAADLERLDECSKTFRELYFTRRSIATLHEFSMLLHELHAIPEFERIRSTFDPTVERAWARAVRYFGKYDRYVKRLRNNVGGHFGRAAGEEAIKHLLPDASGCLEVRFFQTGGGANWASPQNLPQPELSVTCPAVASRRKRAVFTVTPWSGTGWLSGRSTASWSCTSGIDSGGNGAASEMRQN